MKSGKIVLISVLFVICIIGAYMFSIDKEKAKDSYALTILSSFLNSEKSYFESYNKYSNKLSDIGMSLSDDVKVFFDIEDVPVSYKSSISAEFHPYFNQ